MIGPPTRGRSRSMGVVTRPRAAKRANASASICLNPIDQSAKARAGAADADAFIGLHAGAGAFRDADVHTDGVSGGEFGQDALGGHCGHLLGVEPLALQLQREPVVPQVLQQRRPLAARVVAVADSLDAITSTRAFRQARLWSDAVKEIVQGAGTRYDPEIVKKFEKAQDRLLVGA